jgi:RNA polymerase sigma factor (sigma-70 family)
LAEAWELAMHTHMDAQASKRAPAAGIDPWALRALAGDRVAEREICRRLVPVIRAFAARRLRPSSVEDFTHDALTLFIEALREGRIQEVGRLAAFALGICRNLARERARTDERRRDLFERYAPGEAELASWDVPLTVRREHLEDCYSQLTERSRQVIRATFCEDTPDGDIARALAITEANVRIIRHRTLSALRSCLESPISWTKLAEVSS